MTVIPLTILCAAPEAYFSPGGGIQKKLVAAIDAASESLDAALFELSSSALIHALKRAGERGVQVRLVLDEKVLREHAQARTLASAPNVALRVLRGPAYRTGRRGRRGAGMMHNKFAVFDGARIETGSYNWSQGAEFANYENALFEDDPAAVQAYKNQFTNLWSHARPISAAMDWKGDKSYGHTRTHHF